jgi:hypothetical protein
LAHLYIVAMQRWRKFLYLLLICSEDVGNRVMIAKPYL